MEGTVETVPQVNPYSGLGPRGTTQQVCKRCKSVFFSRIVHEDGNCNHCKYDIQKEIDGQKEKVVNVQTAVEKAADFGTRIRAKLEECRIKTVEITGKDAMSTVGGEDPRANLQFPPTKARTNVPAILAPEAAPIEKAPSETLRLDIKVLSDEDLLGYRLGVEEHLEELDSIKHKIDVEVERRLVERKASSIPHKFYDIEYMTQYTPYQFDMDLLKKAADNLAKEGEADEAKKLIRFVPQEIIQEHYVPGNVLSIASILKRYGNTKGIGDLIAQAMTRMRTGEKLYIRRKKKA